jgi:uncharacterized protein YgbK (DUF1537 family)
VKRHPLKSEMMAGLPPPWAGDALAAIRRKLKASRRSLVVLDDDPTGTQTAQDIPVLTTWGEPELSEELAGGSPGFFILTNSRSLPPAAARQISLEIALNLKNAAAGTGRDFAIISRGDSTLRGHYPAETDVLNEVLGPFDATLLFPYFEAGGRYTLDDIHYVAEGDTLVPAAETPFAADAVFGYRHSNLREFVEDRTGGRIKADEVRSFDIAAMRRADCPAQVIADGLRKLPRGGVAVVNACHPRDAECFALGTLEAEAAGCRFLYRTAAQFVAARLGLPASSTWSPGGARHAGARGGLVVVGSHVPKTTGQLQHLLEAGDVHPLELDATALLSPTSRSGLLARIAREVADVLAADDIAVVFTSRKVVTAVDAAGNFSISRCISAALVEVVSSLGIRPRFLVAKGGITSSDVATQGLGMRRALVRGQIMPGIPVWESGEESRFPGMPYVIFPGNVGGPDALVEVLRRLSSDRSPALPTERIL